MGGMVALQSRPLSLFPPSYAQCAAWIVIPVTGCVMKALPEEPTHETHPLRRFPPVRQRLFTRTRSSKTAQQRPAGARGRHQACRSRAAETPGDGAHAARFTEAG